MNFSFFWKLGFHPNLRLVESWKNPRFLFKMCFGRCFGLNRVTLMCV